MEGGSEVERGVLGQGEDGMGWIRPGSGWKWQRPSPPYPIPPLRPWQFYMGLLGLLPAKAGALLRVSGELSPCPEETSSLLLKISGHNGGPIAPALGRIGL